MKRLLLILALVLAPIPAIKQNGAYNSFSGAFFCRTHSACLHEIGHALDQQAGWISDTEKFRQAVEVYIISNQDELTIKIIDKLLTTKQNAHRELYASLFDWAGGSSENMPAGLREFYNWQEAGRLVSNLDNLHFYLTR